MRLTVVYRHTFLLDAIPHCLISLITVIISLLPRDQLTTYHDTPPV